MGTLTAAKVRTATATGRAAKLYGDGDGLYLRVAPTGARSWIQRIVVHGKRRTLGLGPFPLVSLAEAREASFELRRTVRRGGDPIAERRARDVLTFEAAALATYETLRPRWRDLKTAKNWLQGMEKRAFPALGAMPVDRIGREDVLRVLTPIWTSRPEVARKLRQRIRATFEWAQAHGHCTDNPAGEGINGALPSMPSVKAHFRSLPYTEVAAALDVIDASTARGPAKLALRFVGLTAARSGEVREARWSEIDMEARLWTVPGSRMKTGAEHRVPLSDAALAVLEDARALAGRSALVFPSALRPGRPMSDMTLTKVLRDNGLADRATVHGFRASFRSWASEKTNAPHAVMKLCLSHAVGDAVERAYARSDLLDKRRRLMDQWAAYLTARRADVVRIA